MTEYSFSIDVQLNEKALDKIKTEWNFPGKKMRPLQSQICIKIAYTYTGFILPVGMFSDAMVAHV